MPKKQPDLDKLGADFRHAKAAVTEHRKREAQAELAEAVWRRRHRGVPRHLLYDRTTGDAIHPELIDLEAARRRATADVTWCKGLVIACGEAYKGESFVEIVKRNEKNRAKFDAAVAKAQKRAD